MKPALVTPYRGQEHFKPSSDSPRAGTEEAPSTVPPTQTTSPTPRGSANLALTTLNPVKVLRRLTPSYFYPFNPPVSQARTQAPLAPPKQAPNTAKLSSTLLQRPGALTFAEPAGKPDGDSTAMRQTTPPLCVQSAERKMNMAQNDKDKKRRRRSSSLMYQEPPESLEQQSDQAVLPNLNAQWVNAKGME